MSLSTALQLLLLLLRKVEQPEEEEEEEEGRRGPGRCRLARMGQEGQCANNNIPVK